MAFNTTNSNVKLHTTAVKSNHLAGGSLETAISSLRDYADGKTKTLSKKTLKLLEKNKIITKSNDVKADDVKSGGVKSGGVNRLNKANRWAGFSEEQAYKGVDLGAYGYDKYNESVNPLSSAVKSKLMGGSVRKPSPWIEHVKAYAKKHNVSYKEALSKASLSYKKSGAGYNTIR
jgi:hypothetical protein